MIAQRLVRTGDFPVERNTGCIPEWGKFRVRTRIKQGHECIHD